METYEMTMTPLEAQLAVVTDQLLGWMVYFEVDFECDEDQRYNKMKSYCEAWQYIKGHYPLNIDPYRARMYERVKERMAEIKI